MASQFTRVVGLKPRRSRFNVGYMKGYDCDMGQLIPSMCKFMVPGDVFRFSQEMVARAIVPPKSPAMAEINVHTSCFFVPLRILFGETKTDKDGWYEWEIHDHDFEKFITGGHSGNDDTVSLPRFQPTGADVVNDNWNGIEPPGEGEDPNGSNKNDVNVSVKDNGKYSIWDYLEYPVDVLPTGAYPLDFFRRAYYLIYNEWFRDETVMPPVNILTENRVMNCCWKKDYFTSMLPWPQRGDPIAIPLRGNADVSLNIPAVAPVKYTATMPVDTQLGLVRSSEDLNYKSLGYNLSDGTGTLYNGSTLGDGSLNGSFVADLTGITGSAALTMAATFTVNDLRLAFQLQRWQELNARIGSRYVEFLKGTYGVSPTDDTLQRPMFVGGYKSPVIISEVLQTSADGGEGVGSMSGHAIAADGNFVTKFRANEFGVLMAITYIRPKAMYHQGIDKENLYRSRYQFFHPAMVNLGEDAVEVAEIYATNSGNVDSDGDPVIIGYQGRFNELRSSHNRVCGGLRDQLRYWVQARTFDSAPVLNGQFLKCNPSKEIFGVLDEPAFIVMVNNKIPAYRPLPVDPQPGLIDHLYGERR